MATPFDKFFPELQKQKKRQEEVFGKEFVERTEKEAEAEREKIKRKRGTSGGGRSISREKLREEQEETQRKKDLEEQVRIKEETEKRLREQQQKEQDRLRTEQELQEKPVSRIEPFSPFKSALPLPTKRQLGVSPAKDIFLDITREPRMLINEPTADDLTRERGVFIREFGGGFKRTVIPTGTAIDPTSGIRPVITREEDLKIKAVLGGGAGTPKEFIVQDVEKKIVGESTERLGRQRDIIQEKIYSGELTYEQGEKALEGFRQIEEKRAGVRFEKEISENQLLKAKDEFEADVKKFRQGVDVSAPIKTGAIAAGFAVAPQVTAPVLLGLGGAEAFSVVGRPTKQEKLAVGTEAVFDVGFGLTSFNIVGRQIVSARAGQRTLQSVESPFKRGEFAEDIVELSPRTSIGTFGGTKVREFDGDIVEVGLRGVSPQLKQGEVTAVIPKGQVKGQVKIAPIDIEGRLSKPAKFDIDQEFIVGGLFRQQGTQGFRGRVGTPKEYKEIAGFSRRTGKDTFETFSSPNFAEITRGKQKAIFLQEPSIGIGRIRKGRIETGVDIVGGKTPKTPRPTLTTDAPTTQAFTQETLQTGLGLKQGVKIRPPIQTSRPFIRSSPVSSSSNQIVSQKEIQSQTTFPIQTEGLIVKQAPKGGGRFRPTTTFKTGVLPKQETDTKISLGQLQLPDIMTKTPRKPITKQGFTQTPPPYYRHGFDFNYRPEKFGFYMPMIPQFGIPEAKPSYAKIKKKQFFRTPSFAAVQLGITAPEPLKFERTGLIERPIIKKKKKKQKITIIQI